MWVEVGVCCFYAISSISLSFSNKAVFTVFGFKVPLILLLVQFWFNVLTTPVIRGLWPSRLKGKLWKIAGIPDFHVEDLRANAPLAIAFLANVSAGVYALSKCNIPMFLCMRRLCIFFIFVSDVFVLKKPVKQIEYFCVFLICLGSLVAGMNDLNADLFGYALVMLNNILTTFQLQLNKELSKQHPNLNAYGQSFYNALTCVPILMVICYVDGDMDALIAYPKTTGFLLMLCVSSVLGVVLTFSQALCTIVNSPMATSIAGNLKDIFMTALGLFLFGDVVVTLPLVAGLCMSLCGAILYSFSKLPSSSDAAKAKE